MAAKAKVVDWASVEADYRAGTLTDRANGAKHGISHGAVQQRAKRDGWTKDLSKRIAAAREAKVAKLAVAKQPSQIDLATEKQVVDANANLQTGVIIRQRKDIQGLMETIGALAGELGALTNTELQDALDVIQNEKLEEATTETRKTALMKAYGAAMALGSRAGAGRQLAAALSTLIDKERQAFGIDKESGDRKSLGEFLESL